MNYEQKYNASLEQAKKELKTCGSLDCDAARLIFRLFPQLAESEDERIRKRIRLCLEECVHRDIIRDYERDDCLAYLEKQKEQNDDAEEDTDFTIYHPLKNGKGEYECIPYSFYGSLTSFSEDKDLIDFLRTCFYTKEECNEWIKKQKEQESPLTDKAFKEQLERVLRDNVLDTDIRITGDTVVGAKINPEDKGLFLRSLSDEAILKECKERGLDVKYSEEENLAYRLNWVMQDYYKAGEDEEEREHRVKCYKLFWDALEDSEFFNRLESHKEELTKLQEKCKKFVENQKEQKPEDTMDEFTQNIRNLITNKLTVHTKGLDGSEVSSTVFIDDKTAKDIASGILFYIGKEAVKNPNREIIEWGEEDDKAAYFINQFLEYHETSDPTAKSCKEWFNSRLKSLRPSWKPSEEQMDRLFSIIAALRKDYCDDMADFLANLRADLKKLGVKEEPEYYQHFDPDC